MLKIIKIVISSGEELISKNTKEHPGVMEITFNLVGIWDTQVYVFGKLIQLQYILKTVHFTP